MLTVVEEPSEVAVWKRAIQPEAGEFSPAAAEALLAAQGYTTVQSYQVQASDVANFRTAFDQIQRQHRRWKGMLSATFQPGTRHWEGFRHDSFILNSTERKDHRSPEGCALL